MRDTLGGGGEESICSELSTLQPTSYTLNRIPAGTQNTAEYVSNLELERHNAYTLNPTPDTLNLAGRGGTQ